MEACGLCAASTWWPVGYTWRSPKGGTARLDYVLFEVELLHAVKEAWALRDVALSHGPREDHVAVAVRAALPRGELRPAARRMQPRINKAA
eukprot:6960543-Lingulodinium_polyedra.AAC.1